MQIKIGYFLECDAIISEQFENWHLWSYELQAKTCSEHKINFAGHKNGRVVVFRIKMR